METAKGYDGDSIDWRGINPDGTPDERMLGVCAAGDAAA